MAADPLQTPAPLQVVGVCGHTVDLIVGGVTVSFTCMPEVQKDEETPVVLDPGQFGSGHTALFMEPRLLEHLGTYELAPDAEPFIVHIDAGADVTFDDIATELDQANEAGRPVRLDIRAD